ncbi:MAG: helix-hairpin-helix domain-containing protein, partial [Acidobacteriota bacterium]
MFRTLLIMAVVSLGWALPPAHAEQSQPPAPPRPAMKAAGSPAVVNINTASIAELDALPGVGAKTAALIIEYRQKNGPFKKIE